MNSNSQQRNKEVLFLPATIRNQVVKESKYQSREKKNDQRGNHEATAKESKRENQQIKIHQQCVCRGSKSQDLFQKIKHVKYDMKLMSSEMLGFQEEVHLLLANFFFILELTEENIVKQTRKKLALIVSQKNEMIKNQGERIQRLLEQREIMQEKYRQELSSLKKNLEEKGKQIEELKNLQQKIREQGSFLKEKTSARTRSQMERMEMEKNGDDMKLIEEVEDEGRESSPLKSKFQLKKRNTLQNYATERESNDEKMMERIKSLGDIRDKIHRLKSELKKNV